MVLQDLNLTQQQFVDFCILCGNDYIKNIPGIGPVKSYGLISKYSNMETIKDKLGKSPEGFEKCRELFTVISEDLIEQTKNFDGYWEIYCSNDLRNFLLRFGVVDETDTIFCPTEVVFEE